MVDRALVAEQGHVALLVDDHPLVLEAMTSALTTMRCFRRIDRAGSLQEAHAMLAREPDTAIVLLDLHLSDASGTEAFEVMREEHPDVPVVILSAEGDVRVIEQAFEAGVRGYLTKDLPLDVVTGAVRMVLAGQVYVPAAILRSPGAPASSQQRPASRPAETAQLLATLTPRQQESLRALMQGIPNKVIARRLGIAEGTVKSHLNTVYRVLGAKNRLEALVRAHVLGLC